MNLSKLEKNDVSFMFDLQLGGKKKYLCSFTETICTIYLYEVI
jgi:hypothetical protein